jgi:chromate reductase
MQPMATAPLRVVGFAGSLREGSFNRALLNAVLELAPADLTVEPLEIRGIPLYNADLDTDEHRPHAVVTLKRAVEQADGVLIVSPEYNYGTPGVVKNVVDWASRPGFDSPFLRKPVGIMGAARGRSGTMRGQEQLKLTLLGMASQVFPHPGVAVDDAPRKFDDEGRLTHEATRKFVASYLEDFTAWVRRVG